MPRRRASQRVLAYYLAHFIRLPESLLGGHLSDHRDVFRCQQDNECVRSAIGGNRNRSDHWRSVCRIVWRKIMGFRSCGHDHGVRLRHVRLRGCSAPCGRRCRNRHAHGPPRASVDGAAAPFPRSCVWDRDCRTGFCADLARTGFEVFLTGQKSVVSAEHIPHGSRAAK